MSIIIDGYNLLNVTGIIGRGIGPGTLERSRNALMNFVVAAVDPDELRHTTVVFDAKDAPPGLPRTVEHRALTVHYASQYEDADTLIEELIRVNSAPRRLTVVSSDHRIQRAARRRRATAIDSDVWYARMVEKRRDRDTPGEPVDVRPGVPLPKWEVERWLKEFGDITIDDLIEDDSDATLEPADEPPAEEPDLRRQMKPSEEEHLDHDLENPFPPGYADDLVRPTQTDDGDDDLANPFPPGYGEDLLE